MAQEFTSNQVKELITVIESLLKRTQADAKVSDNYKQLLKAASNDIKTIRFAQGVATKEITNGNVSAFDIDSIGQLITYIDEYILSENYSNQCNELISKYGSDILDQIKAVKPASGSIRWFFTGKGTKEKAGRAYEYLNGLLASEFSLISNNAHLQIDQIGTIDTQVAIDDFISDKKAFRDVLLSSLDNNGLSGIDCIGKISQDYDKADKAIANVEKTIAASTDELRTVANKVISRIVLDALKEIPVDELNRSKSGLKTGILASNGLTTVADVYAAPVYQIASLRGISQDGAYTIKDKATELAKAIMEGTKLKLNYDNKTNESTELIKRIYNIRPLIQARTQVNNVYNPVKQNIDYARLAMDTIGNGLPWLFYEQHDREILISQYQYLRNFYDRELSNVISGLSNVHLNNQFLSDEAVWEDFRINSISYYNILDELLPGILGNADSEYGLPEDLVREIQDECFFPDGLLCDLRKYQEWGVKYILHQKRALLGDEMGLGKTIQSIATMVSLRNIGETHFIVVCPASVLANWCREIVKHSKLRVIKIHGASRSSALKGWIKAGGVAVTTYETTAHIKFDESVKLGLITVDEAHYIKNPNAARSKNVRALCDRCERVLFMTGTALENRVEEMISLVNVLRSDIGLSLEALKEVHTAPKFREKLAPVYFRRKQVDVNNELPDKIEYKSFCTMMPEEKQEYEDAILSKNYALSRRVSWMMDDLSKSSKAQQLKEIVEEAYEEDRKVIVFSFFLDTVTKVKAMFGDKCTNPINGSVSPDRRQEIIDDFTDNPHKRVLVAQIQSGGTGLNIQAGSVVVICEPQLKPSIENQAIARAHRMGQSRSVLVYRLLCEDSIDEKLMQRLAEKQALFDTFADKSVAAEEAAVSIDDKSFGEIIEEEIERIKKERGIS